MYMLHTPAPDQLHLKKLVFAALLLLSSKRTRFVVIFHKQHYYSKMIYIRKEWRSTWRKRLCGLIFNCFVSRSSSICFRHHCKSSRRTDSRSSGVLEICRLCRFFLAWHWLLSDTRQGSCVDFFAICPKFITWVQQKDIAIECISWMANGKFGKRVLRFIRMITGSEKKATSGI